MEGTNRYLDDPDNDDGNHCESNSEADMILQKVCC